MGGEAVLSMIKSPKDAYLSLAEKGALTAAESSIKVFGQSFMAGCYIGFGALLAVIIAGAMPEATANNPGLKSLVFAFLFPVNLLLILLSGGILFTGTAAALPAAVYEKKARVVDAARCVALSWIGNMLGSMFFALFTVECDLNKGSTKQFLMEIALKKTSHSFDVTFARGIGCNWMVCMAVLLQCQAQDMCGKVVAIYLPISTFVMIGFEHIPANFYLLGLALLSGDEVSFTEVLLRNWIPTTLGNFVAGAFIVAGSYSFFFGRLGDNQSVGKKMHLPKSLGHSLNYPIHGDDETPAVEDHCRSESELETRQDVELALQRPVIMDSNP